MRMKAHRINPQLPDQRKRSLLVAALLVLSACSAEVDLGGEAEGESALVYGDNPSEYATSPSSGQTPDRALVDVECKDDGDCISQTAPPCQRSTCQEGACTLVVSDDQAPCEDGNPCTSDTFCSDGSCIGGRATACSDNNPCTSDSCDPLTGCSFEPIESESACDDGDPCSIGDMCDEGVCTGAPSPECKCSSDDDCVEHDIGENIY